MRLRIRATLRSERRAGEREAIREQWSQRSLVDVAVEAMHRGDEVGVRLSGARTIRGAIIDAGRDYAVVDTGAQRIAVRLAGLGPDGDLRRYDSPPVQIEITSRAHGGGTKASGKSPTFASLIAEYDAAQQLHPDRIVEIGTTLRPDPLLGRVRARAWDHVYLRDLQDREVFVALATMSYIAWADDLGG